MLPLQNGIDRNRRSPSVGAASGLDDARLSDWLRNAIPGFAGIKAIDKFPGGQSNPTYRVWDGGQTYVLRRKPFGPLLPSAHAIDREFRLISALHPNGFPVPRPYVLCEDAAVFGAPFYVMGMIEGRSVWDGALPGIPPSERGEMYRGMIATLARLHEIDPIAVGLGGYGAPGNYFARQVRRWIKQYRAAQTEEIEEVERLIAWLPETLPQQDRTSIIHGDYRIDNLIYAADGPQVVGVLDWELSTLGDPLADFAYLAMNWAMPADERKAQIGGLDLVGLGIPGLADASSLYSELTGRSRMPDLNWHFAYNLFRLVGIVQGIKRRFLDGNASNAKAEEAAARVGPLAKHAWHFARCAGARD